MVNFKLKNIGLIENSNISLNDITLICGQNNTGKTYITYSIYGFLAMWRELIDFNIPKSFFEELDENGFISIDILTYHEISQ
jgi:predicted ATPase